MGKYAARVYTDQADIARLEALIAQLPADAYVVIQRRDGSYCEGVVCERPNAQVFRGADENEGINALLRLQQTGQASTASTNDTVYIWLDEIAMLAHPDSMLGDRALSQHPLAAQQWQDFTIRQTS
jgi:hypothetical protein